MITDAGLELVHATAKGGGHSAQHRPVNSCCRSRDIRQTHIAVFGRNRDIFRHHDFSTKAEGWPNENLAEGAGANVADVT